MVKGSTRLHRDQLLSECSKVFAIAGSPLLAEPLALPETLDSTLESDGKALYWKGRSPQEFSELINAVVKKNQR